MAVIVGSILVAVGLIGALMGVLTSTGPTHPSTEHVSVFDAHVTGSTSTLLPWGIAVGVTALLSLSVLLVGARGTAARGRDARRHLARSRRETAFVNRDHDAGTRAPGGHPIPRPGPPPPPVAAQHHANEGTHHECR